ncbi:MAG: hypothetical protein AAF604_07060 [Acidobacteriota bacterium]
MTPPSTAMRRLIVLWALLLGLWLFWTLPLALGQRTLFFRDVFSNHFVLKAYGAERLAAGEIPAFNDSWGLGQPFRGNPSALAFYPDNLLYRLLPFWSAFNLHFALHWLLAALTLFALARELGQGWRAATLASLTYGGSGWVLSGLSFYNIVTVAAWWPLVIVGVLRGGRRGLALGGLAVGMALLGGEPVTALLGGLVALVAAIERHGVRRGLLASSMVAAIGGLIALPQLVASLRIGGFTFRSGHGLLASQAVTYTLDPRRYLELLIPFPFGRPIDFGPSGFWAAGVAPQLPFYLTLYAGIVGLWLALEGAPRHRPWALLAGLGLLLSWLAGLDGELLVTLTFGMFRFPEKFLFLYALALPLLAGWGLERVMAEERPRWRLAAVAGAGALALAGVLWSVRASLVGLVEDGAVINPQLVSTQIGLWLLALGLGGALLLAAVVALRRRWFTALVALQLVALLQLTPLLRTEDTAPYGQPGEWAQRVGAGASVFSSHLIFPPWHPSPVYRIEGRSKALLERFEAADLAPAPNLLFGLRFPLYPDIEGLSSQYYSFLLFNLARMDWQQRVNWMRTLGVEAAVVFEPPATTGLRTLDSAVRGGVPTILAAVDNPAPVAWWPRRVVATDGPLDSLRRVAERADPLSVALAPQAIDQGAGRVWLVASGPDRLELEVSGEGGLVVVQRSFHPLWQARSGEQRLDTLPVDLTLTGVRVPAGDHRVVLAVSSGPEKVAAVPAVATLAACLGLLLWRRRP